MTANAAIEELRLELAKLKSEHEVLEKSHRRLVAKLLGDPTEVENFLSQMAVDRVRAYPRALKST
ncbi:MAG TPA: hypothetical protein VFZ59_01400 [Verrucomicrobiae bacterium]|nr:hypothetical protein [Verrucomicrobiae bacterium]